MAARSDRMTVSLVGYTNAGKSTLMNALTGADVLTRGQAVRHARHAHPPLAAARLGAGAVERHGRVHSRPAAQSDRQLQGDAGRIAAGRSAVARGRRQQPGGVEQIAAVYSVLEELGIEAKDTLLVLNKVDAARRPRPARRSVQPLPQRHHHHRRRGTGIERLRGEVQRGLEPRVETWEIEMSVANGGFWPSWPLTAKSFPSSTMTIT